jgi:iron(III) transport system substrate-binding protein
MDTDRTKLFSHRCASVCIGGSILLFLLLIGGCSEKPARQVVLYTSIDQPIAAPIVREFEEKTGIKVTLVTDTEATKSVGLAERLRAEKSHPQADVWWSNEIFLTINLAEEGLLAPYDSPSAADVPARFKDAEHRWAANGMRVRVIVAAEGVTLPRSIEQLTDASWRGRLGIARPTAGTTGGHVAAIYALWGEERADQLFRSLRTNEIKLLGGNSVVAEMVGKGTLSAGLTDNDDAVAAAGEGGKLQVALPDQDSIGTLVIPTTVSLVNGAKHADEAKPLIDFLLSKSVEQKLIDVKFAYGSVRDGGGASVKAMDLDYRTVAAKMPLAVRRATAILEGRE